jgi:hypothetical protein
MPEKKPRKGSKGEKIMQARLKNPKLSAESLAEKTGCSVSYVHNVLSTYDVDKHGERIDRTKLAEPAESEKPRPIEPAKAKKVPKKAKVGIGNGKNPGLMPFPVYASGRQEYRGHEGVDASFEFVSEEEFADVREARAYMSSIRATLDGLGTVEETMGKPGQLSTSTLQVVNILKAASRVADRMIEANNLRARRNK